MELLGKACTVPSWIRCDGVDHALSWKPLSCDFVSSSVGLSMQIFSKAFESSEEEVVIAAFESWHVLIDALADIKYIHKRKSAQATMVNPIAVMLRKSSPSIRKVRFRRVAPTSLVAR